jgi:hypothetical protein
MEDEKTTKRGSDWPGPRVGKSGRFTVKKRRKTAKAAKKSKKTYHRRKK